MNIYKNPKTKEILCSPDGKPKGWDKLGFDPEITYENRIHVIGYAVGKAIFDTEKMGGMP